MNLTVKHDTHTYEVSINADYLCDLCQTKYPEDQVRYVGDVTVCEGCHEHYTDSW